MDQTDTPENEDEVSELFAALFEAFTGYMDSTEVDLIEVMEDVVRFAVIANHMLMYEAVSAEQELKVPREEAAAYWLEMVGLMFKDLLTNRDVIRDAGTMLGEPEIRLKLSRQVRRRL